MKCSWLGGGLDEGGGAMEHRIIYLRHFKAGLNSCDLVMVAILSGSKFQSFVSQENYENL